MEKLDKKDRKILSVLAHDSRISYTELAKHILLSKNATKYRLDQLVSKGVVESILPVINYIKLGLTTYDIFLKCNPTGEKKQKLENYLSTKNNIIWSTAVFGQYDYFFELICKSPFELDKIMQEMVNLLGDSFKEFKTIIGTRRLKIQPLVSELQEDVPGWKIPKPLPLDFTPIDLDKLDCAILKALCEDGRASYLDIASKAKTTLQTVRNRMQKLIESTVIEKFMPMFGYNKLGYVDYILLLKTNSRNEDKLAEYFKEQGSVKMALHVVNTNELELFVCVQHPDVLEHMIVEMKEKFPEQIVGVEFMHITKELRLNFFPEI